MASRHSLSEPDFEGVRVFPRLDNPHKLATDIATCLWRSTRPATQRRQRKAAEPTPPMWPLCYPFLRQMPGTSFAAVNGAACMSVRKREASVRALKHKPEAILYRLPRRSTQHAATRPWSCCQRRRWCQIANSLRLTRWLSATGAVSRLEPFEIGARCVAARPSSKLAKPCSIPSTSLMRGMKRIRCSAVPPRNSASAGVIRRDGHVRA